MTPAEFTRKWKHSPVIRFRLTSPLSSGLSRESAAALKDFGLPQSAEPWLSFGEFVKTDAQSEAALIEKELFPVGVLANGSLICIEKRTDRLVIFDRDDPDDLWILNSSLQAFYESAAVFDGFITEVNRRNPKYSSDFRIPEGMLSELGEKLADCDPEAMAAKGYWYCELNVLDDSVI